MESLKEHVELIESEAETDGSSEVLRGQVVGMILYIIVTDKFAYKNRGRSSSSSSGQ